MMNMKMLTSTTVVIAGLAGFSTGWAVRPPEKLVLNEKERLLYDYETHWNMSEAERTEVKEILHQAEPRFRTAMTREKGRREDATDHLTGLPNGSALEHQMKRLGDAAGALIVAGKAKDLKQGVEIAAAAIDGGQAKAALDKMVAITNEA